MANAPRKQYRLEVAGRVQDVSYRAAARRAAERCGVVGWVENRRDGTVLAVIQGDPDGCAAFIAWARVGDSPAEVHACTVTEEPVTEVYRRFHIRSKWFF